MPVAQADTEDPELRAQTPLAPIQHIPAIEMTGSELEPPPENESSPELSKEILYPPGLEMSQGKHSFALSDVVNEDDTSFEPWPIELAGVDINIAPDGTYIETSTGPAARELKRRYDQRYGVSLNFRSPYAITAFVNQHGKQMFRVGHRELSAPAASSAEVVAEVEDRVTQAKPSTDPSQSPRTKRRSRMSMHTLFPPHVFMTHRPLTTAPSTNSAPKKLRKARSIPDMVSIGGEVSEHGELAGVLAHNGRAHSQSVTAMDLPRFAQSSLVSIASRNGDIFGDVMDWFTPASGAMTNFSSQSFLSGTPSLVHTDKSDSRPIIAHPFGVGVAFETPLKKPSFPDYIPAPRHVRPMQSFESGLTARQDDPRDTNTPEVEDIRPPSAIRIMNNRLSSVSETASRPSSTYEPPAEASMLSEYATTVFDVLQTYRGLPSLDKLEFDSEAATVKISLSTDLSAVPRDDPRFVIWGEATSDQEFDGHSTSRDSVTSDFASTVSKRRASKVPRTKGSETSSHTTPSPPRILLAATIERWIAQLTSDLNYDELLDFFLTYRTYISGVDLCHLLISRFHWALQQPKDSQDESVRQIVRVRTFVAIRYWLLTFFTVDFVPNRELRLLMSNWLNTLIHDPLLKQHSDGLGIARRLVKVAKECKQAHIRTTGGGERDRTKSISAQKVKTHVLGQRFAEAVMKDEDSDVDLDFLPEEAPPEDPTLTTNDPANAHLGAAHVGAALTPTRSPSLPLSSFNILQRIDHAPGPNSSDLDSAVQLAVGLPMQHSALSRAFVKTIGRLGRLKRVLHSRSSNRNSISNCTGVSTFDLDTSVARDLLAVNGRVEKYLQKTGPNPTRQPVPAPLNLSKPSPPWSLASTNASTAFQSSSSTSLAGSTLLPEPSYPPIPTSAQQPITPSTPTPTRQDASFDMTDITPSEKPSFESSSSDHDTHSSLPTPPPELSDQLFSESYSLAGRLSEAMHLDEGFGPTMFPPHRAESIRSFASSTGSLGEILDGRGSLKPMFAKPVPPPFDVVSLDDFDMSDTSSEVHDASPPLTSGLRKEARKLPMRKDFEFLPRRSEVSSMGIVSRTSVTSGPSSATSSASIGGLGGGIQQWQMNALLDSLSVNEEDGDVDAALKRLEGQINPKKMQEKKSKVDGWVKQIQARLAAGDYEDELPRFPADSDEEDESDNDDDDDDFKHESVSQHNVIIYPPPPGLDSNRPNEGSWGDDLPENPHTPMPTQHALNTSSLSSSASSSDVGSNSRSEGSKSANQDVVLPEIVQSRVSTILPPLPGPDIVIPSRFATQDSLHVHQSFILSFRAATLAEQFSMIDRELFMGVKFEELVTEEWMATEEVNVYDWSQYLKDRAAWKAEQKNPEKTTALAALRARFNLMASFVTSEIVLTQPNQRPLVVAKFIRIAWKSYQLSNFNTLVAIIAALQGDRVAQAMRKSGWNRVGSFETRVYRDLKVFVSGSSDFSLIRSAVEAIVDAKPKDSGSHTNSLVGSSGDGQSKAKSANESKSSAPTACVPFIGIYLAQLHRLKRLPDLVDPTSPNETVGMNSTTGDFDPPAHPEVFDALAPLPPAMRLEPLVNVHKQRKIAAVIKSLVAGQHIASRVNLEVDKKLFQRCLRLRALDPELLQRAMAAFSD